MSASTGRTPAVSPPPEPRPDSLLAMTAPVAMGYLPLGAVFGFLFVHAGAEWWLAILASVLVYAGAAQYAMIPMLAAGLPAGAIALAIAVINLRHMFYGLSLLDTFPARPRLLRWYMVFALTDETWSVLTTLPRDTPHRRMALFAALNQLWWVLGTAAGVTLGARVEHVFSGLDFVLACLFAVLAVEQWRARSSAVPLWVAVAAYALTWPLAPEYALVTAIALSVGFIALWQHRATRKADHD